MALRNMIFESLSDREFNRNKITRSIQRIALSGNCEIKFQLRSSRSSGWLHTLRQRFPSNQSPMQYSLQNVCERYSREADRITGRIYGSGAGLAPDNLRAPITRPLLRSGDVSVFPPLCFQISRSPVPRSEIPLRHQWHGGACLRTRDSP